MQWQEIKNKIRAVNPDGRLTVQEVLTLTQEIAETNDCSIQEAFQQLEDARTDMQQKPAAKTIAANPKKSLRN